MSTEVHGDEDLLEFLGDYSDFIINLTHTELTKMVSGYGRGTTNRRNTCRNITRRSPSTNMGNYPSVELGC